MDTALPTGTQLNNGAYVIRKVLGQGGFGIVYEAQDARLQRLVAIKEFFPQGDCVRRGARVEPSAELSANLYGSAREGFLRESQSLACFEHSGIVNVYAAFEENNTAYMVMELLRGRNLEQVVTDEGPMAAQIVIRHAEQIASALEVIHDAGLLHLDVKPQNIILADEQRAVLVDFGIAKKLEQVVGAGTVRLSQTMRLGTHGFAPPEQYGSSAHTSERTDVYSLGATLYFLLTAQVPLAATERVAGCELVPAHRLNPAVPHRLSEAITGAMEMRVDARPQSIAAFREHLLYSYGSSVQSHPAPGNAGAAPVPPAISTGTAALLHNLQKHDGAVRSIAFSADGALLASGSSDRAINVWDVGVGRLLQTLVGHADWINRLDFVGDTHVLASGSHDGSVRLWNADSGQHVQTMEPSFMERLMEVSSVILDVATSPDGRVVASTSGRGVVRLWSCDTYRLQSVLKGHTTYLSSLAYSADNRLLACCDSGDGLDRICIWEWQHQKMISAFNVRAGGITALAFSPDAKVIATSGRDGTVRLWNPLNGELLRTLTGNSAMNAVAFSPDGTRIAAGSANGSLRMWDAQERGLLHSFRVHDGAVQAVAFQPGSDLVATAGADSVVRIWRI